MQKEYNIRYTYSSRNDIRNMKSYILEHYKYRKLGENFTQKIKAAADGLRVLPRGYETTGFRYKGYDIFLKPYRTYLLFYIIDDSSLTVTILRILKDGMNWRYIIKRWLKESSPYAP